VTVQPAEAIAADGVAVEAPVVIVTGGTFGIGQAITLRLAEAGYRVVTFGLNARQPGSTAEDGTARTEAELARRGLVGDVLEADVTDRVDVERVAAFALERHGRIDALVNNAAIHVRGDVFSLSQETWDRTISVNLTGMFITAQVVTPHIVAAGGGSIVNVGSASGWGRPGLLAYSASKGGVFGFSSALAYDLRSQRVRVNVVVPGGPVLTGMTEGESRHRSGPRPGVAGRPVEPRDVANAVQFLLSPDSAQITGAVLNVGGFLFQSGG
jgi:NAD(P)-dependent dehydrogenase (short-subunit alcohol dehydrogenase family)